MNNYSIVSCYFGTAMVASRITRKPRHRFLCDISPERAEEMAEVFHLLGDVNRLRLVCACMGAPICVQDLADRFDLSPSLVSHHLRLLRAARLVRANRRGKQIFYTIQDEHVRTVLRDMITHVAEEAEPDSAAKSAQRSRRTS